MKNPFPILKAFLANPIRTGSVAPSSRALAENIANGVPFPLGKTIVELGPGTGAITEVLLEHLAPGSDLIALEIDEKLSGELKTKFPNLLIENISAESLGAILKKHGKEHADSIVASLPWAWLPTDIQENLLREVTRCLEKGGHFCTFGYLHASWFPRAQRFKKLLQANFQSVSITSTVWQNLPPAIIYNCKK